MAEAGAQLRINFAEWMEKIRQICKELATKTEPYQGGYTNSLLQLRRGGVWLRKYHTPWSIRQLEWKCVVCYRFKTWDGVGWSWCGWVTHLLGRSLVCFDCKTSWSKHRE
jgi:hypothetical protein